MAACPWASRRASGIRRPPRARAQPGGRQWRRCHRQVPRSVAAAIGAQHTCTRTRTALARRRGAYNDIVRAARHRPWLLLGCVGRGGIEVARRSRGESGQRLPRPRSICEHAFSIRQHQHFHRGVGCAPPFPRPPCIMHGLDSIAEAWSGAQSCCLLCAQARDLSRHTAGQGLPLCRRRRRAFPLALSTAFRCCRSVAALPPDARLPICCCGATDIVFISLTTRHSNSSSAARGAGIP